MKNHFEIVGNKMLFWRLGNINSNLQKHWKQEGTNQPPVRRGLWCFPYPHYDYFFCYHQWTSKLPKFYREELNGKKNNWWEGMDDAEQDKHQKIKDELLKKIKQEFRPRKFFYGGEFYSHISYDGKSYSNNWFLWDSVKDWSIIANKKLICFESNREYKKPDEKLKIWTLEYTKDHLEIFIPNY